jgi:hypothetical protein
MHVISFLDALFLESLYRGSSVAMLVHGTKYSVVHTVAWCGMIYDVMSLVFNITYKFLLKVMLKKKVSFESIILPTSGHARVYDCDKGRPKIYV